MEPGPPETKRPRLSTGSPWSSNHGVSLPHPTVTHHPPVSGPHHPPPPAYQPAQPTFSRPPEPTLSSAHHHPHDDRRHHHEHEPYPPIQEPPRQLPSSPAHPPYPHYAPREPVVKRDPGEEPNLPQLRRPNSTGNVTDGLPHAPHGPPHTNHQIPEDPRRHMSFDNGPMPHSPALYRPPPPSYHAPPTPVAQHQYENPHVYGPPAPMYPTLEIQAAASAKRKAQRASQACDSCRQLKAKCDETKPCKNCRDKNMDCKYRDPPAKQPDKVTADILDMLSALKEEMTAGFARQDHRLSAFEKQLDTKLQANANDLKVESIEEDEKQESPHSPAGGSKTAEDALSSPGGTIVEPPLTVDQAQATLRDVDDDDLEAEPGLPVKPGKPAMPPNHTTHAGLLLKWRSIRGIVGHHLSCERIFHVDEFPIRQEQQRGMLRVFGRGEGFDEDIRPVDKETPQEHTMTDVADDFSDVSSPTPAGEAWGQVGSITPPPGVDYRSLSGHVDGNPDWDPKKVWKYVESFKENILNMHPIIIPKELDAMVRLFLEALPKPSNPQPVGKVSTIAKFVNPSTAAPSLPEAGTKRKRSSPVLDEANFPSFRKKPGRPYRSVHSALVLLVLALGKICLHKDKIPDVVHDSDFPFHSSPSVRNGVLASPLQGSPPGYMTQSLSSGLPSPKDNERHQMSRRPSLQGALTGPKGAQSYRRNMDVIPGLEYFALATDIIGSHVGGHNLKHVYVHILAGLYHGQLGRVIESWSYISLASRTLQVILRPSLGRLCSEGSVGMSRRDNQLAFAFWTCLQLESDILAELPLPQSGILQYEDRMPYPSSMFASTHAGFSEEVVSSYVAQLYLRKQLNKIHSYLYDQDNEIKKTNDEAGMTLEERINDIQGMLREARAFWVPRSYSWADTDPPANEILAARLRAKYWGSQVILYRPFLRIILEREHAPPYMYRNAVPPTDIWASLGMDGGRHNIPQYIDPRTIQYARLAIEALIESTRAFHGMDPSQRVIITNVFGTAHAQWGNLLTLAACYRDDILSKFIDSETLGNLFSRTISFFRMIVSPTSALLADLNILTGLARDLGLMREEYDMRTNSFSSMGGNGPLPPIHNLHEYNSHGPPPPALRPHHFAPPPPPHSHVMP
ncbi:hypothetical protein F4780DRAFT_706188 [Xylariomycetidae sp. FL0641]|nr:hypothetical protein F4780DRAFT_706188 [Xylariomycetidae sp. FL0641]